MISGKNLVGLISIFILFFGIISSIVYDGLYAISHPTAEAGEKIVKDLANIVVNSQGEIANAVDNFPKAESTDYATFLIGRIFVGSLITLFMIWLFYRIFRFFVEAPKPTDKLMLILLSIVIVWVICVVASYYVGKPNWIPFYGWVKLAQNREMIANYLLNHYFGG